MKKLLIPLFLLSQTNVLAECVPAHEYYPFVGDWVTKNQNGDIVLGMYARISPDGKYVLRSYSGNGLSNVTVMALNKSPNGNSVTPYNTPLSNEAFPVFNSWRYIVSTGGEHYRLSDLMKFQKNAKKQFTGGIKGFYTANDTSFALFHGLVAMPIIRA